MFVCCCVDSGGGRDGGSRGDGNSSDGSLGSSGGMSGDVVEFMLSLGVAIMSAKRSSPSEVSSSWSPWLVLLAAANSARSLRRSDS